MMSNSKNEAAPAPRLGGLFDVLKRALGDKIDAAAETFFDILAEDIVMEFPFAVTEPRRIEGMSVVRPFFAAAGSSLKVDEMVIDVIHATAAPDVTIIEFHADGINTDTGRPYNQRYILLVTTRDGRISHYRTYFNPLAVLDSAGELPASATS